MVASGNDFILIEKGHKDTKTQRHQFLAKQICNRRYGVGADGLLILEKSKVADIRMRIFNVDGSEAKMCGNGARCVALFINAIRNTQYAIRKIETKAGIIAAEVDGNNVSIKLTDPEDIKLDIPIKIGNRYLKINFIDTGVPHTVIFVEGLDKIDVFNLGRQIRYHKTFYSRGTNVDFVEVLSDKSIKIRTYERGVEDETLSCGTGMVAAALVTSLKSQVLNIKNISVHTKSGEILEVYFERIGNDFKNVWLQGEVSIVFKGEFLLK